MSTPAKSQLVKELIARGRDEGLLTEAEVDEVLTAYNVSEKQRENILKTLSEQINIVPLGKETVEEVTASVKKSDSASAFNENAVRQYIQSIYDIPFLEKGEEFVLGKIIQESSDPQEIKSAKDKLVQSNLRFVISIAKHFLGRGVAFEDLIQTGNIGLMKAADKYDYTVGTKFTTYAAYWIKQAILRTINNESRMVRVPDYIVTAYNRACKEAAELRCAGKEVDIQQLYVKHGIPAYKINDIIAIMHPHSSIEETDPRDDGRADTLLKPVIKDTSPSVEETTEQNEIDRRVRDMLSILSEREKIVLIERYGLNGGRHHTLEEIGSTLDLSRERVRQIEAIALQKLRTSEQAVKLGALLRAI